MEVSVQSSKRSDSSNKPCRALAGPEKDHLTVKRCPCCGLALMEFTRAGQQKRSDSSNKPCRTVEKDDWAMKRCPC